MNKPISHLYIYKKPNEHTLNIFSKNLIWASKPCHFNDPFDCNLEITDYVTVGSYIDAVLYHSANKTSDKIKADIEHRINTKTFKFNAGSRTLIEAQIQSIIYDTRNYGVLCFSEHNDNILMWSHYSDCHKGLCFKIELFNKLFEETENLVKKVNYSSHYPTIDLGEILLKHDGNILKTMLFTKSIYWSYENEWRIICQTGDVLKSLPGKITEIYFGLKRSADYMNKVYKASKEIQDIKYYQAKKKSTEFAIQFKNKRF